MKLLKSLFIFLLVSYNTYAQCWSEITAGYNHTLGIQTDGTLWAWGRNDYGQLGDGSNTNKNVPTQIGTDNDWHAIAAGDNHSMAIKNNGTLWAWGRNNYGQLGDGTTVNKNTPFLVNNDIDWKTISLDREFTIALKNDETLWGWGRNGLSQLGNADVAPVYWPTQIGTDNDWKAIETGIQTTTAIKNDNTFWGWGAGANGVLGNGNGSLGYNIPTQTLPDADWDRISLGESTSLALKSDGSLWAWGVNSFGAVGNGTFINTGPNFVPNHIGVVTNWISINMGRYVSRAINGSGELFCWGYNSNGQVGDGTIINRNVPTPVGLGNNWLVTSGGEYHSIGLTTNHTLWAWGDNSFGQLGDGTFTSKLIPTQIGSTCTLATDDFNAKVALRAFPNPAQNNLTIQYNLSESATVQTTITNYLGQILYSQKTNKSPGMQYDPVNLSSFPSGVYLISVYTNNLHDTIKIIKN